jgi:hypothetical protein
MPPNTNGSVLLEEAYQMEISMKMSQVHACEDAKTVKMALRGFSPGV